jgi:nucleotide-binding universal stress UspA family protein
MLRSVVVPVTWGEIPETAIAHAATVARQAGARLRLVTVAPPSADRDRILHHLDGIRETLDIDADMRVIDAYDPATAIAEVGSEPDTLLCMATHARRPLAELVLGSVSAQVVRRCHRPVLLVGPKCRPAPPAYQSMVVAVDGSGRAETILPTTAEWCVELGLTPWLYQALPGLAPFEEGTRDVSDAAYVRRVADWFAAYGCEAGWDTSHDRDPAAGITRFADEHGPGIVALTTHGRSGPSQLVMGGVAMAVAHHATCPILVLHPDEARKGRRSRAAATVCPADQPPRRRMIVS